MLRLIADYNVSIELTRAAFGVMYLAVLPKEKAESDFRLAEATLQMNCDQSGELTCPICASKGKVGCCGHLTFTGLI